MLNLALTTARCCVVRLFCGRKGWRRRLGGIKWALKGMGLGKWNKFRCQFTHWGVWFKNYFLQFSHLADTLFQRHTVVSAYIFIRTGPPWESNTQSWCCKSHALSTEPHGAMSMTVSLQCVIDHDSKESISQYMMHKDKLTNLTWHQSIIDWWVNSHYGGPVCVTSLTWLLVSPPD